MSSEGDRREDPERKEEEEEEEEFEDANSDLNDMTRPSEWSPGDEVSLIFFFLTSTHCNHCFSIVSKWA